MTHATERRARRMLRWYPAAFRERYGDELQALLEDELTEDGPSVRRTANVAWSGLVARATASGIAGAVQGPDTQARRSLAWLCGSLAAFLAFGLAMWSQVVVDWQWRAPTATSTTVGTVVMSLCALGLAALAAAAAAPVLGSIAVRLAHGERRGLVVPVVVASVSLVVLVVGARRFENGWPGTGGHRWAEQGMVPGGVAAFVWAATLGVTAYWAHPTALGSFPAQELVWMAVSPLAIGALVGGATTALRRLPLSAAVARYELWCGRAATALMAAFLFGTASWLVAAVHRPPTSLFHAGAIDVVGAVVMTGALWCAWRAATRGETSLRRAA